MAYILDEMYKSDPGGGIVSDYMPWASYLHPINKGRSGNNWVGYADLVQALDQNIVLNITAPPGTWTGIYFGLMGQLGNWEFNVKKVDESIDVSPMYKGFYEMVMGEKQNIEIKVKKVIDDIISHTSELELLQHDLRRYKEFYDYFNFEKLGDGNPDDHSLKAVFIDMVDYHSGEGTPGRLSMSFMQQNNIFPTIIQDFYQMKSLDDLKDNPRLRGLANVEKDMLTTKFKAFEEWKALFGREVKTRYERLKSLSASKEKMIEKSREWIKPYIARHNMLNESLGSEGGREGKLFSEYGLSVQPMSRTIIKVWAWKEFPTQEFYKTPSELVSPAVRKEAKFIERNPDGSYKFEDNWTMDHLILNDKLGLKAKYPFITKDWVQKKVNEIMFRDDWFRARKRVPDKIYYYYAFLEITFKVSTARKSTGQELEDMDVEIQSYWMTRNVLLTKLLELKAKQAMFEKEIEDMLGIDNPERYPAEKEIPTEKKKVKSNAISDAYNSVGKMTQDFLEFFGIKNYRLSNAITLRYKYGPPPYETSWKNRISKFYLVTLGRTYYGPVQKFVRTAIMK